jgi:membrane protein insertase Oxa1/YidC/SpoIIIJ
MKHSNYFKGWPPQQINAFTAGLRKDMLRKWRANMWRGFLPWLQFPIFIGFIETLRAMGGSGVGLFGALKQQFFPAKDKVHGEELSGNLIDRSDWFEPTFHTEGLSWCTDLTVPDPTGTLPILAPTLFAANVLYSSGVLTDPYNALKRTSSRLFMMFAGGLTMGLYISAPLMPAGLLYYWVWSSGCALVAHGFLNWRYPVRKITATKREVPKPKGRQV